MAYKHILLAVELGKNDKIPTEKAVEIAKNSGAKLTILHSIEHVSSYGAVYGVAVGTDIEEILMKNAVKKMRALGKKLEVREENLLVKFGPAKFIILEEAEKLGADLIVVGSHGRHGIRLLLGSTANAVIHSAKCDVLAARLKEK